MELKNKNGDVFTVTEDKALEVSAATLLLEESFENYDGTPDEFLERAHTLVPTPTFLDRNTDTTWLGNAVFIGIGTYGHELIRKIKNTPVSEDLIFSLFNYTLSLLDIVNILSEASAKPEDK